MIEEYSSSSICAEVPETDYKQMAGFQFRRDSKAVGALHELPSANELKKALQCPICEDVPLAPIYTCSLGHTICGQCRLGLKCGLCGEDLTNSRNKAVELIVASSSFWCNFMADGCPVVVKGADYRAHARECDFRRITCNEWEVKKCDQKQIRFRDYFKHLQTEHQMEGFVMNSTILCMSEYSNCLITDGPWPSYYFEYEEDVFLRNMKIQNSIFYMWFTMIGSDQDAANYRFKVTMYMKHDESSTCDWVVPVYSIRKSADELEKSAFRIALPSHQLELYCSQQKHPNGDIFKYVFDLRYELLFVN